MNPYRCSMREGVTLSHSRVANVSIHCCGAIAIGGKFAQREREARAALSSSGHRSIQQHV